MLPRCLPRTLIAVLAMLSAGLRAQQPSPAPAPDPASPPKPKLSPLASLPDWKKLSAYANTLTQEEFESAAKQFYLDRAEATPPWSASAAAVSVDASPPQPRLEIPFRASASTAKVPRFWRSMREFAPIKPGDLPLKDFHIALDPGHIGGSFARMEERWLSMMPDTAIMEGALTLQVAYLLKRRLEALGARVSLVRSSEAPVTSAKVDEFKPLAREILKEAGFTAPKENYDGLSGDAKLATVQWQAEKLFYRVSEIRARAKKVNTELKPDLVICLHFNAEAWGDPAKPEPVAKDHFHLLINGCYSADELQLEDVRFEMLQRLFQRTHDEEKRLAESFAPAMSAATGLPAYEYTTANARRIGSSPFIYARNLLANRLYECPVIYLEPYVMNNMRTYKRLLLGPFAGRTLLDGELVTSPQEDYARGVVEALLDYAEKERATAP